MNIKRCKNNRFRFTAVLLIIAAGLLSACGGDTGQTAASSSGSAAASSGPAADSAASGEEPSSSGETEDDGETGAAEDGFSERVTFMIYMVGSDLESSAASATEDLAEIAASGVDPEQVDLLVYTGGAPKWHTESPAIPADANVLYHLTADGYEELERYEPRSMGDPASLTRFLQYGYDNYPADAFDLILWDHGNGPLMGYGKDKQFDGDALTLPELRTALEDSPFGPEERLDLIGFDACLMSSAELMCVTADYADLLVASQETEPSFGWNYAFLEKCGHVPAAGLGQEIVADYMEYCGEFFSENEFFQSDVTLSVMDLARTAQLEQAIDGLFAAAAEDVSGDYSRLAAARVHSHGLGRASTGSEYDLVDLESLLNAMEERYPEETESVRSALEAAVLCSDANIEGCSGVSLFYPFYNKKYYQNSWKDTYAELGLFPHYLEYLDRYDQVWLGTDLAAFFDTELAPQAGSSASTYTMQLTEEQLSVFASGSYYILRRDGEGIYSAVFLSNDVTEENGLLTAQFDGNIIYVCDDYGEKQIPVNRVWDTVNGVTDYTCPLVYAERGEFGSEESVGCDVQFSVDQADGTLTVKGFYEDAGEDEMTGGKRQLLDPYAWDLLQFYSVSGRYLTRDEDGRILSYWDWPQGDWITWNEFHPANGLHFSYEPLYDDGHEYFIMFNVQDVQGNEYSSELLPITLAERPAEEAGEVWQAEWGEETSVPLWEEDGVGVELYLTQDPEEGTPLFFSKNTNSSEYPVRVDIGEAVLDGKISVPQTFYTYLDPGQDEWESLAALTRISSFAGTEIPRTLEFKVSVTREDNGQYLLHDQAFRVTLPDAAVSGPILLPVYGAMAERQTIGGTEDISIELLSLGEYLESTGSSGEYGSLTADFRVSDLSGKERTVRLLGIALNGIFFNGNAEAVLRGEDTWYCRFDAGKMEIAGALAGKSGEEPSIGKVSVLFSVDGETVWCPVDLQRKGTQDSVPPRGELVLDTEELQVYATPMEEEESYSDEYFCYSCEMFVVNRSGRSLYCSVYLPGEDGGDYLASADTAPDTAAVTEVSVYPEEQTAEFEVSVRWKDMDGGDTEGSETVILHGE